MQDIISIYYEVSEIMSDDVDKVASAIVELTDCKYSKRKVLNKLENLRLKQLEDCIIQLSKIDNLTLKSFNKRYQSSIFDYLEEE